MANVPTKKHKNIEFVHSVNIITDAGPYTQEWDHTIHHDRETGEFEILKIEAINLKDGREFSRTDITKGLIDTGLFDLYQSKFDFAEAWHNYVNEQFN